MAKEDPEEHEKKTAEEQDESEQVVNPWVVSAKDGGKIDYDKLIIKFGCQKLDESHVQRIERLTNHPAHVFLRRGIFFAHRCDVLCIPHFSDSPIISVVILFFVIMYCLLLATIGYKPSGATYSRCSLFISLADSIFNPCSL